MTKAIRSAKVFAAASLALCLVSGSALTGVGQKLVCIGEVRLDLASLKVQKPSSRIVSLQLRPADVQVQHSTRNAVDTSDIPPDPCREVELMFFDSQGNIRQRSVQCLMPGHAAFLDGSFLEVPGLRAEIRAAIDVIAPPPDSDCNRINLVATVEVFDNDTGRTSFVLVSPPRRQKYCGQSVDVDVPVDIALAKSI